MNIQYFYSHTTNGFKDSLSVDSSDPNYNLCAKIFEKIRINYMDSSFIYAYIDDSQYVLYEKSQINRNTFVSALLSDEALINNPIDCKDSLVQGIENMPDALQNPRLPVVNKRYTHSADNRVASFFPLLLETVVLNSIKPPQEVKPIVVLCKSDEEAVLYLQELSLYFPLEFMLKCGICIGEKRIPDEQIQVSLVNGETKRLDIKLHFMTEFADNNYERFGFDVLDGTSNCHSGSYIYEALSKAESFEKSIFIDEFRNAFNSDGSIDIDTVEYNCTVMNFRYNKNSFDASKILSSYKARPETYFEALRYYMQPNELEEMQPNALEEIQPDIRKKIFDFASDHVNESNYMDKIIEYYLKNKFCLTDEEIKLIIEKNTYSNADKCLNIDFNNEGDILKGIHYVGKILNLVRSNGIDLSDFNELIVKSVEKFDYRKYNERYKKILSNLIKSILSSSKEMLDTTFLMLSIVMINVFKNNDTQLVDAVLNNIFIDLSSPLKNDLSKIKMQKEQLIYFAKLKLSLIEIANILDNSQIERLINSNFIPRKTLLSINNMLIDFSLNDLLDINSKIIELTNGDFVELLKCIKNFLLDINVIKKHIKITGETKDKYDTYFYGLNIAESNNEIKVYLENLEDMDSANNEIHKFRLDFAVNCFKTMSPNDQKKVNIDINTLYSLKKEEQISYVETIHAVYLNNRCNVAKVADRSSKHMVMALLFAFLSLIIMSIAPIVQGIALDLNSFGEYIFKIADYFEKVYFLIPIIVMMIHVIVSILVNHGRIIARANKFVLFSCIIPLICYNIAYITFYFFI